MDRNTAKEIKELYERLENNRVYWIWLAEATGQGSKLASMLVRKYRDPKLIFELDELKFDPNDALFDEKTTLEINRKLSRRSLSHAYDIIEKCNKLGINIITADYPEYPSLLGGIRDFPIVLYYRGRLPDNISFFHTTVVGTRTMSDYGRRIAYMLGMGIAYAGGVIVSGMALGADSMAMIGALEAGGVVVAVLGSGVDVIYPKEHKELYFKILNKGAVISEYPPGTPPMGKHFPVRNRIMSGLSAATVVVEAGMKSGALITAERCLDQGRKLFAVPGQVGDNGAEGPNTLIRDGALPVITPEDVICEFIHDYPETLNLDRAHSLLRDIDAESRSAAAMARSRIGVGGGAGPGGKKNYYGKGAYGGRVSEYEKSQKNVIPQYGKRNSDEEIPSTAEEKYQSPSDSEKNKSEPITFKKIITSPKDILSTFFSGRDAEKFESDGDSEKNQTKESNNFRKNEKQIVNSFEKVIPAKKIELDMLDEAEIKVYNRMKPHVPVLPDELSDGTRSTAEILTSLTILETAGAVESGGGGYYMRVSPDDITESQND